MSTPTIEDRKVQAAQSFAKNAARLGLTGELLGQPMTADGVTYTIIGLARRVRNLPVIGISTDGRVKGFTVEEVLKVHPGK